MLTGVQLADIIKKRGMFKSEAARRCGYTPGRITQFLKGDKITKGAAIRLIAGLKITEEELSQQKTN